MPLWFVGNITTGDLRPVLWNLLLLISKLTFSFDPLSFTQTQPEVWTVTPLATSRIQKLNLISLKSKQNTRLDLLQAQFPQSEKASIKETYFDYCNSSCQENGVKNRVLCSESGRYLGEEALQRSKAKTLGNICSRDSWPTRTAQKTEPIDILLVQFSGEWPIRLTDIYKYKYRPNWTDK